MAMLLIIKSDVGFTIGGVTYDILDIDNVQIDDPQKKSLVRGMNAKNQRGIKITDGQDQPYTITANLKDVSKTIYDITKAAYKAGTRFDFWIIDRDDGSSMFFKDTIFNDEPMQKSIASGAESVNIAVVMQSFNKKENWKSENGS